MFRDFVISVQRQFYAGCDEPLSVIVCSAVLRALEAVAQRATSAISMSLSVLHDSPAIPELSITRGVPAHVTLDAQSLRKHSFADTREGNDRMRPCNTRVPVTAVSYPTCNGAIQHSCHANCATHRPVSWSYRRLNPYSSQRWMNSLVRTRRYVHIPHDHYGS